MTPDRGVAFHETDLPTQPRSKEARPRLPGSDANREWAGDHPAPTCERAETPGCLRTHQVGVRSGGTRLRRGSRVRESKDFRRVHREGVRRACAHFVVVVGTRLCDVGGASPALGVTVSKKVGTAVERNRVKRRVREWFRCNRALLPPTAVVIVIARKGAAELSAAETEEELGGLLL
jgi:ribonuclease P protein component